MDFLMAGGKVVAWAVAMIRVGDRLVSVPRGTAVPPGADPDNVKLLEKRGAIVKGEPTAGVARSAGKPPFRAPKAEPKHAEPPTPPAPPTAGD